MENHDPQLDIEMGVRETTFVDSDDCFSGVSDDSRLSDKTGDIDQKWVDALKQDLQKKPLILKESAASVSCCIHRVPPYLRQANEEAYNPQVVSFGPFHYGDRRLRAVEEHKGRYLKEAVDGAGDGLEIFLAVIKNLEQRARECYSETFDHIDSNEFVQMLLLDACFIIQFLLKQIGLLRCSPDDPILNQRCLFQVVRNDLLLLENQIPFFILQSVFKLIAFSNRIDDSLPKIVCDFFKAEIGGTQPANEPQPKHLLGLLHLNLFPLIERQQSKKRATDLKPLPSATQLRAAGVKFRNSSADGLDITFEGGVVKIPRLTVGDDTKSLFLNLTAFEELYPHCSPHITAYTFFVDCLIDTAEDVSILRRKGIIDNWLGSDQEVADLFNELGRGITIYSDAVYLGDVINQIHQYRSRRCNAWRASFVHNHLNKPWAIFSLIGAIILLVLTFLQTFFTVFHPPT